jgi:ribonuclease HI
MKITIYTDGACSGNPGIGGWGVVILIPGDNPIYLNGGSNNTTNNQMELTATIESLKYFKESKQILIFTDSKYVMNGIETWIKNWKINGWKTASKKPVKNKDLWEKLDKEIIRHTIEWKWVKGHAGNENNEKADFLARRFIEKN